MSEDGTASVPLRFRAAENWYDSHNIKDYEVMAALHFHPSLTGFSQQDIELYEADINTRGLSPRFKQGSSCGLLLPVYGQADEEFPTLEQAVDVSAVKLFIFSGPANGNYYQAYNFNDLSIEKQVEILRESGMKVTLVDLPVTNGSVDLSPIPLALKQQ